MKKEEIPFLGQLVEALEQAEAKLEIAYKQKNYDHVEKLKKFMIQVHNKIFEVLQ